jgi:intracellular multiplication protein IcmD
MRKIINVLRNLGKIKNVGFLAFFYLTTYAGSALAADPDAGSGSGVGSLGDMATKMAGTLGPMAQVVTGGAFLAGLGFAFAAILKFKAHKDNPTQIPIGTPIALLFIAVALLFLPSLFKAAGGSLGLTQAGSISGTQSI